MDELNNFTLDGINLNNYRNFYVVAKTLNFTKAAELLNISQPAISYSIKKLEEELNCKLFERNGKALRLTEDGVLLNHYVKISYKNLFTGMQKIQGTSEYNDYIIKIGVQTHIGTYLLSGIIDKFLQEYPGVKFKIVSKSTSEMVKMLEYRELDFIVDSYPITSNNDNIKIIDLIEFENCFVANKKFVELTKKKKIFLEEFVKYPLLLPSNTTSTMIMLNEKLKEKNISLIPKINVSTTEVMLDMVKRGLGIGYFTRMSVMDELISKKLYEIPVNIDLPTSLIEIAYIEDYLSKPSFKFIEFMKEQIENHKIKSRKHIRLVYTQKCPYKCSFCHKEGINNVRERILNPLDIAFLFNLVNKNIGMDEIHITGGEPLVEDDYEELIKNLYKNQALITVTSNGYYIDEKIESFKYLNKVNISLHSMDEECYEKITKVKGSFEKVVKNIKLLRGKYPVLKIGINMTLIKGVNDSFQSLKKVIEFSKSINASLKIIELFNNKDSSECVNLDNYIQFLENQGYSLKKKTFRKSIYENKEHEILLTRCTCDVVKNIKGNACKKNNDLYITMDGLIDLCRFNQNNISIYDEIVNRNEEELLLKIDEACDKLGEGCICQKK